MSRVLLAVVAVLGLAGCGKEQVPSPDPYAEYEATRGEYLCNISVEECWDDFGGVRCDPVQPVQRPVCGFDEQDALFRARRTFGPSPCQRDPEIFRCEITSCAPLNVPDESCPLTTGPLEECPGGGTVEEREIGCPAD